MLGGIFPKRTGKSKQEEEGIGLTSKVLDDSVSRTQREDGPRQKCAKSWVLRKEGKKFQERGFEKISAGNF